MALWRSHNVHKITPVTDKLPKQNTYIISCPKYMKMYIKNMEKVEK